MKNLLLIAISFLIFIQFLVIGGGVSAQENDEILNPPENFIVDLYQESEIILLWDQVNQDIDNYQVLKGTDPDTLEVIKELTGDESSFIDDEVVFNETYYYQIIVQKLGLTSAETDIKEIILVDNSKQEEVSGDATSSQEKGQSRVTNLGDYWNNFVNLFDPESDNFWLNLVALNVFLIGIISAIYLTIKSLINYLKNKPTKEEKNRKKIKMNTQKKEIKLKMGEPDIDIVDGANKKFLKKNKSNLDDWLK